MRADLQRREWARTEAALPVTVRVGRPAERVLHTATLNLGAGGMLVSGGLGLDAGELITVELRLEGDDYPVAARGRVVRVEPDGTSAIAYEAIDARDRERLDSFTLAHSGLQLRIARCA